MASGKYKDPVTGDPLSTSEHITRIVQDNVIRTWWFLGFFTLTTILAIVQTVFIEKSFHPSPMDWWNVWASWTAVIVEGLIGRYMTGMTRRDSTVLRATNQLLVDVETLLKEVKIVIGIDAKHSEEDYKIDLESNSMLEEVLDTLNEIQNQIDGVSYYEELDSEFLDNYYREQD